MRRFARLVLLVLLARGLGVGSAPSVTADGTRTLGAAAAGDPFGDAVDFGSMQSRALARPVVGMAATRSAGGYWLVAEDGGVFSFGDAAFYGSTGAMRLNRPIVGMAATPSGRGYWFVAADGGVFSFGDARFFGSTGAMRLQQPIVGMAATPSGRGYWLVARDGGIFTFGDATFAGSAGGTPLGAPVVGMAASPSGLGYWLAVADGRVLPYGDAPGLAAAAPAASGATVAVAATPDGSGYWAATSAAGVTAFGAAPRFGAADASSPVVGMAATSSGRGYWLVSADGSVLTRAGNGGGGSFGFLSRDAGGGPMRYDPCRPVRFVVNPAGAPAGAVEDVREAFRRLGAATGISFADAGTTDETHLRVGTGARAAYQPLRYGPGQWAPILVSFADEGQEPILAGDTLGYGGSTSYWTNLTDRAYVTGEVVLDRDLRLLRGGFGPGLTRGNLVLHELGHVAGLDHVGDRGQVMYASISPWSPDGYGPGDRAGLERVGSLAGCLNVASPVAGGR